MTSQQEQQAILVLVQQHVIHNHTQSRCRGDRRHLLFIKQLTIIGYILPQNHLQTCRVVKSSS